MRFDEHNCLSSRESVFSAIDGPCVSFTVSLTVSGVSVAVWVLDEAQVVVSGAVVAVVGTVVDDNVALAMGHSGCERRGWECCCGAVGRLGSECHRPGILARCLEAGNGLVTAIVNDVVSLGPEGSGCKGRVWGRGWGAVGSSGGECRRSEGPGGGSEAERSVVVVVDDGVVVVDIADGGCAAVVSSDVAVVLGKGLAVKGGLVTIAAGLSCVM